MDCGMGWSALLSTLAGNPLSMVCLISHLTSAHLVHCVVSGVGCVLVDVWTRLSLMLLSSAALVIASDSSGIFFQQAMQRVVCFVQCSISVQLGVCGRFNGTDFPYQHPLEISS